MSEQEVVTQLIERTAVALARQMRGIVPERVYPPDEAAELIGYRSERGQKSIREIEPELLPALPISPGGKLMGYLGRDLIAYVEGQRLKHNPHLKQRTA